MLATGGRVVHGARSECQIDGAADNCTRLRTMRIPRTCRWARVARRYTFEDISFPGEGRLVDLELVLSPTLMGVMPSPG